MEGTALGPGPEFDLIRSFLSRPGDRPDVRVGPGDDAAVVVGDGIVLSTDLTIEGTHFRRGWVPSFDVGWRAGSAALSDLAAMAARPIGVLVSLAVTEADVASVAGELMAGITAAVEAVGGVVLGGDLTRTSGPLVVDVTVVGEASEPVLRSGATPGDELWVTGALGGAAACVSRLLRDGQAPEEELACFARPTPRVAEAIWLRERGLPRAMIDLSDGLAGDAGHLAAASGVAAVLDRAAVPVHPAAHRLAGHGDAALRLALSGGEDYELLFAARPGAVAPHVESFQETFGLRLSRVGVVVDGSGVWWSGAEREPLPLELGGYQHFGARP